MSDFLTRLAERALGHGHAVEPLLPSLWETAPLAEEGLPDASTGLASTTGAAETSSTPGHAGPSSVQPASVEVSPQAVTADAPTPPPLRPAARVEREEARPDVAPPPLVRPTPPSIVPATFETAVVREQVEHLERVEVHSTRAGAAVPDTATSRETQRREERASAVAPVPTGAPAPLLPRVTERSEELRPLAAAISAPAPAPRVEITIGRIDVRATPKSGPSPKSQRPAAASHERLSLQEYLAAGTEKRGGGRP